MTQVPPARLTAMCPQLLVSDMHESIAFYTSELGFVLEFRFEEFYAGLARDGHCIHLKSAPPTLNERQYRRANEHLDISFGVTGIDDLYADIRGREVEVTQPLRDMRYGREFYIADPDGYILGFLEPPDDDED